MILAKGELFHTDFVLNDEIKKDIQTMNESCRQNLAEYEYDFTLTALKEFQNC